MQGAHLVVMESGAFYQIPRRKKNALHLGAFQGGGWLVQYLFWIYKFFKTVSLSELVEENSGHENIKAFGW